jgi:hypothetical protein
VAIELRVIEKLTIVAEVSQNVSCRWSISGLDCGKHSPTGFLLTRPVARIPSQGGLSQCEVEEIFTTLRTIIRRSSPTWMQCSEPESEDLSLTVDPTSGPP